MPLLQIQTNISCSPNQKQELLATASKTMAETLGKPESYVMVSVNDSTSMFFAGNADPTAYVELKSIGLPENKTAALSASICTLLHGALGIPTDRIYIEFANAERHMWGWDGATF